MVGDLISQHRQATSLSQALLGKAIGLSGPVVSQRERPNLEDRNIPALEYLCQVAAVPGLTLVDFFVPPTFGLKTSDETEAQLLESFRAFDQQTKKAYLTVLLLAVLLEGYLFD
jgi:transcriptional regulator with XRE-family HTH domain